MNLFNLQSALMITSTKLNYYHIHSKKFLDKQTLVPAENSKGIIYFLASNSWLLVILLWWSVLKPRTTLSTTVARTAYKFFLTSLNKTSPIDALEEFNAGSIYRYYIFESPILGVLYMSQTEDSIFFKISFQTMIQRGHDITNF